MATLLLSDIHLSGERPEIVDAFVAFLAAQARSADALYILGDLFDLWLGDDDRRAPHSRVIGALRGVCNAGVPVRVVRGNHDFLLGPRFAAETGCELLDEPANIDLYGTPVVILHGDVLCTRDEDYQAFRRMTRDEGVQRRFLSLPLGMRESQAASIRHRSQRATRLKPADIMDVTPGAVIELMRKQHVRHMVHGHTHRPDVHHFEMDDAPAKRIVLGDWYESDSVLVWDESGHRMGRIADVVNGNC